MAEASRYRDRSLGRSQRLLPRNCEGAHWQLVARKHTCGILGFLIPDIELIFCRNTMALCHRGLGLCVRPGRNSTEKEEVDDDDIQGCV